MRKFPVKTASNSPLGVADPPSGGPTSSTRSRAPLPPSPPSLPILGHLLDLFHDPLPNFVEATYTHGDVVRLRFPGIEYVLLNDPDGIKRVLVDEHERYPKSKQYEILKLLLGNGLVTSEGAFWRRQRRLAQPAFHPKKLGGFATDMTRACDAMLDRWERFARTGEYFDVAEEMQRVTFRIAGETLFSIDLEDESQAMGRAISVGQTYANDLLNAYFPVLRSLPTKKNREFHEALRTLDGIVYRILEERRRRGSGEREDLLSMLMNARDEETGEGMSEAQLRDEIVTLISAGHETTATAMAWTFVLLAWHPDVDARLHREVTDAIGSRTPTEGDLPKLGYARAVVEESMRLYPPVWGFERRALVEDEIGGYRIPKDASVGVFTYALHRHPVHFPNPERFDPARFFPENAAKRHKYAYLPFGGGPRVCIGNQFALMEAELLLARIVQRYRIELDPRHVVTMEPLITLRPKGGIRGRLLRR